MPMLAGMGITHCTVYSSYSQQTRQILPSSMTGPVGGGGGGVGGLPPVLLKDQSNNYLRGHLVIYYLILPSDISKFLYV
jgi:hypothetical protein